MDSAVLAEISKDEHERAKFMSRRKAETDRISNLLTVKKRTEIEMANKLKALDVSNEIIMQVTGMSVGEIEELCK